MIAAPKRTGGNRDRKQQKQETGWRKVRQKLQSNSEARRDMPAGECIVLNADVAENEQIQIAH